MGKIKKKLKKIWLKIKLRLNRNKKPKTEAPVFIYEED